MERGNGGFSEAGLRRLRDVLARHVESKKIPGLVALAGRGGQTYVEAIGTMRPEGGAPMRRDTIFRMASTTKPVAVAAAMVLLDECRLRLDDPIDRWLPELADGRVLQRVDGPLDDTGRLPRRSSVPGCVRAAPAGQRPAGRPGHVPERSSRPSPAGPGSRSWSRRAARPAVPARWGSVGRVA
jgi:hypothetical protein